MKTIFKALLGLSVFIAALIVFFYVAILDRDPDRGAATPTDTAMSEQAFEPAITQAQSRVAALRAELLYPSISAAVMVGGKLVWLEAIGYADVDKREVATTDTRYSIGSISKSLTATAAMRLAADGALDLDIAVESYWQDLPAHYHGISLRQLLSHQAGVRHYKFAPIPPTFSESYSNKDYASVEDGLSIFIDEPPLFAPDQAFQYSSYGYSLASHIMEEATGKDFLTLMDNVLIDPLHLEATMPNRLEPHSSNRAHEYLAPLRGAGFVNAPKTNTSSKWAGGGFVSTPLDLARFGAALLANEYLGAEQFTEMTTPRRVEHGEVNPQNYGLGWRRGGMVFPADSETIVPIIHHGGTAAGTECVLLLVPESALVTAFCGNAYTGGSGSLMQLAANVARDFMRQP